MSEPFAYHSGKGVGSTVRLSTTWGDRDFRIAGIYYDYGSTGEGRVMMSREVYVRLWDDDKVFGRGGRCGRGRKSGGTHCLPPGCGGGPGRA